MEYSAQSLQYLHIAYVLMALGQVAYVAFLAKRWHSTTRADATQQDRDV